MIGQTLSHYRIVSKIGAGGMGEVYLAHDTKLDRRVALKILPEQFAQHAERMRRFVQEAKCRSVHSKQVIQRSARGIGEGQTREEK